MSQRVLIIGGGQAALQVAVSLRAAGFDGDIRLIGEELHLPYMRPPLSKRFLTGKSDADTLSFRLRNFFDTEKIDLTLGVQAIAINRTAKTVRLSNGRDEAYDTLILATGTRTRKLDVANSRNCNVAYLRTLDDAIQLVADLESAKRVVIMGGGFIGLEVAAAVAVAGKLVTVLEGSDRLMARAISPALSARFLSLHREHGVDIVLGSRLVGIEPKCKFVQTVTISGGREFEADLIVAGIGVVPNSELATACGLATADGIIVDSRLKTSDRNIFAIGDCARFPMHMQSYRLESVQNAVDQAKFVAEAIMGSEAHFRAVPWFWTEQYNVKLQIAGIKFQSKSYNIVGDYDNLNFSIEHYHNHRLESVESVNSPGDHLRARKRISQEMMADQC